MNDPFVSVIIPVFNQAEYILSAIDSIHNQRWKNLEIVVVNDGSTDDLEYVLSQTKLPITYIRQENRGPSHARNRGIMRARGNFLSFLDADDLWPANRLISMFDTFATNPEAEVVLGTIDEEGQKKRWLPSFGASLVRKSVFESVGLLDESLKYSEDQDWFLRAKENGTVIISIPNTALQVRVNPRSMTYNKEWKELEIHKVLKKSLDRRKSRFNGKIPQLKTLSAYEKQ